MASSLKNQSRSCSNLSSVLVGDELGLLKRIDLHNKSRSSIVTLNKEFIKEPSPSSSVVSIRPFVSDDDLDEDLDEDGDERSPRRNAKSRFGSRPVHFLVASKPNQMYLYNSLTNQIKPVDSPVGDENNETVIVGAQPVNRNTIIVCYENGNCYLQNVDKEILESSSETKKKAIKLLGLDLDDSISPSTSPCPSSMSSNKSKSNISSASSGRSTGSTKGPSCSQIFQPNYSPSSSTTLECFDICNNRLAIAGKNIDLKVFDLNTKQCIFTGKSTNRDWLGMKHPIWVSDLTFIGAVTTTPSMVATCSRSDAIIRIYDLKSKQRKPVWMSNLKDNTYNNDSNPPSFTTICSIMKPKTTPPTQQLILGTTMGRMLAVDVRFNSHTCFQLGVFRDFTGGSLKDIKYVPQAPGIGKVLSCSLDRFVRIHNFGTGANNNRQLETKFYMKTRPTCIQPVFNNFVFDDIVGGVLTHIDDEDGEGYSDEHIDVNADL